MERDRVTEISHRERVREVLKSQWSEDGAIVYNKEGVSTKKKGEGESCRHLGGIYENVAARGSVKLREPLTGITWGKVLCGEYHTF